MITDKLPLPEVIEPDSQDADAAIRARWVRAWRKQNPDLYLCPLDAVDPSEWQDTDTEARL